MKLTRRTKWILGAAAVLLLAAGVTVFILANKAVRLDPDGDVKAWVNARYAVEEFSFAGWRPKDADNGCVDAEPMFRDKNGRLCVFYTISPENEENLPALSPEEQAQMLAKGGLILSYLSMNAGQPCDWKEGETILIECALRNAYCEKGESLWHVPVLGPCIMGRKSGEAIHLGAIHHITGRLLEIKEQGIIRRKYPHITSDFAVEFMTVSDEKAKELLKDAVDYRAEAINLTFTGLNEYDSCSILVIETEKGRESFYCSDNILRRSSYLEASANETGTYYNAVEELPLDKNLSLTAYDFWYLDGEWKWVIYSIKDAE